MKLLIFGIDGMSMDFIKKHIDKFDLFRNGMKKGCYSTMPAPSKRGDKWNTSMDMWTSFYTGLPTGEHGLRGEYVRDMQGTRAESKAKTLIELDQNVQDRFFWNLLNKKGYKVGLFNGIVMSPVFPIDGFVHGSFPQHSPVLFYPENLKSCWVPNLNVDTGQPRHIKEFGLEIDKITPENVKNVYHIIGSNYFYNGVSFTFSELMAHFETVSNMAKEVPIDVLFYYNLRLDLIQHFSFHDPSDKIIIQAYQVYEIMLTKLIERFNPDNVMVISDHGLERSEPGRVGAVPVPGVKDTNICLSINKCVLSGQHSEEAVFILWGKDIKEKGEIKMDIIKAYDKILEMCK